MQFRNEIWNILKFLLKLFQKYFRFMTVVGRLPIGWPPRLFQKKCSIESVRWAGSQTVQIVPEHAEEAGFIVASRKKPLNLCWEFRRQASPKNMAELLYCTQILKENDETLFDVYEKFIRLCSINELLKRLLPSSSTSRVKTFIPNWIASPFFCN